MERRIVIFYSDTGMLVGMKKNLFSNIRIRTQDFHHRAMIRQIGQGFGNIFILTMP
jgi:hypothetical protein